MIKNNSWSAILALLIICCMVCGCITDGNGETAPPTTTVASTTTPTTTAPTTVPPTTTAPPLVYTFPKYGPQLQEGIVEWSTACDIASAEWQSALGTLRALAGSSTSAQDELYQAFADYNAAIQEYERVLQRYYALLILSEHTGPTESGLLALMNETVPFDRPEGDMCPYESLNIGAEQYGIRNSKIDLYIRYGVGGQKLLDAIDTTEAYLPIYHDMVIGYVYYEMNRYLTCLSHCTDDSATTCGCSTYLTL